MSSETNANGEILFNGKTFDEALEELENCDEELQRMKEQLIGTKSTKEPVKSGQSYTDTVDDLQKTLEASIHQLHKAIDALTLVQRNIEKQCDQSKLQAIESHQKAQSALANHDMTAVFQHSVDKAVHIKVVQTLRDQAGLAEDKVKTLKRCLTNLEKQKTKFQNQAKIADFQAFSSSADPSVESLKQQLNLKMQRESSAEDIIRGDDLSCINIKLNDL